MRHNRLRLPVIAARLEYEEQQQGHDQGVKRNRFHQREADLVYLCICDVVGHGIAAALLAARVNSFVRHAVIEVGEPCRVVTELNDFIFQNFGNFGVFVTFFCLAIDLKRREIKYAGCGHPPALLYRADGESCVRLSSQHEPIGVFPKLVNACQNDVVPITAGDRILLYTDGIIEARNQAGDLFGIEAVESVLARSDSSAGSPQLLDETFAAMDEFRHSEQDDDVLVVAARII